MKDDARQNVLTMLGARAAQDPAFRKKLLLDPRAAICDLTDASIPSDLRIKFVEKDPDVDVMIVLPDLVLEDGELTEDDIAAVAGGTNWGCQDVITS
jgi:hypothetical protein